MHYHPLYLLQGNSPSINDASQGSKKKADPRKMWVHVKATGDMLEINLDKDRPVKFETKDQEVSKMPTVQLMVLKHFSKKECN